MKKIFTLIVMLAATLGMQAQDTWTIAGVSALCGSSWSATDTSNDMVLESGSTYKLVKEGCVLGEGTNYEYKVLKNHEWGNEGENNFGAAGGGNAVLTVAETGTYTVTFAFVADDSHALSAVAVKTGGAVIGEKTWTVAGAAALLGVEWDPSATENDMVKQSDGTPGMGSGASNEIWSYGPAVEEILTSHIMLRERMRDYTRSLMEEAHEVGRPVMRPLFYEFPGDANTWEIKDEYFFGADLLVAPVLSPDARQREVYLPEGASWTEVHTGKTYEGGSTVTADAPLEYIPVFARDGRQAELFA